MSARRGGALLPVLILAAILFMLSAMLPQLLVAASSGLRHDQSREVLLAAAESGVAFAEARLKNNIEDALTVGTDPALAPFTCKPTMENPDYGDGHLATFDVAVTSIEALPPADAPDAPSLDALSGDGQSQGKTRVFAYRYQLVSHAVLHQGRTLSVQVSGIMAFTVNEDRGPAGGLPVRTVTQVKISPIDTEMQQPQTGAGG